MSKLRAPDKCVRAIFKDAMEHENENHQCKYNDGDCNHNGIKFLEKVELNLYG